MNDLARKIISKSKVSTSQQARIPAPGNIDTNHDVDAKNLASAPPLDPDNDGFHPMTYGEAEDVQNLSHLPPNSRESDRASPGAFRMGGQDNDDGNTATYGKEVRSCGTTTYYAFQVTGHLVEENPEESSREQGGNNKHLKYILIAVSVISVIVAIVLVATLSARPSQSGTNESLPSTTTVGPPPTQDPKQAPTQTQAAAPPPFLPRESMISLIQSRSTSTSFPDFPSQSQALDWILSDPYSSDGNQWLLSDDRLVQRFALATLYYSTSGVNWDHVGWLEFNNECLWGRNDVICAPQSVVEELHLSFDSLSGRIPIELALLTQVSGLSLDNNQLTGSIPSELSLMTKLTSLNLYNNQLTGSIPSEFGVVTKLTSLNLYNNQLTGSIPSALGLLTKLASLCLYNNHLTGSIPSEIGLVTQLSSLYLHTNQLTGSIPSQLGLLIKLTSLGLGLNRLIGSMPSSLCSVDATFYIDCGEIACTCCLSGAVYPYTSC
jgi:Leucine-rich repeat (LRR) protein